MARVFENDTDARESCRQVCANTTDMTTKGHGENIYIIGAGAIGKVLDVLLSKDGKKVVLLRGSIDNDTCHKGNIGVMLHSKEAIEAEVTIDTISNYRKLDGVVVLCNKSY